MVIGFSADLFGSERRLSGMLWPKLLLSRLPRRIPVAALWNEPLTSSLTYPP
jgi:hypothetical protein